MNTLDEIMIELLDSGLSPEQMRLIREKLIGFALMACFDSEVKKELGLLIEIK